MVMNLHPVFVFVFQLCENIERIERFSNMSQRSVAEDFLKRDVPFIVSDAMDDWPALSKFSISFLNKVAILFLCASVLIPLNNRLTVLMH